MEVRSAQVPGGVRFSLSGDITEDADFESILKKVSGSTVLDLSGIKRITSPGVREWIRFIERLGDLSSAVRIENASPVIVGQLNMISNFGGKAAVVSISAPYYCSDCDDGHEVSVNVEAGVASALDRLNAAERCPRCKAPVEFDDLPARYLAFLQKRA